MKVLFLALGLSVYAQPTIGNISVDNVTSHGARITWTTNVGSMSSNKVCVGTSTGTYTTSWYTCGNNSAGACDFGSTDHGWFLNGLEPGKQHFAVACSATSGAAGCTTSGATACAAEQTFSTLAAEPGVVTTATLPAAVADMTPPTSFTTTYTVGSDCSDAFTGLQAHLNTAANQDGAFNYKVVIPASTVCTGQFVLPNKSGANASGTGKLVLTTDTTLPPNGSQLESSMGGSLPRIISKLKAVDYYQTTAPGSCSDIGESWVDSDSTNPNAFLHWCTNTVGPVWTAVSMSSGTTPPGTCTAETLFFDTDEADPHYKVHYCFETNKYINWNLEAQANYTPFAALYVAANAHDWIIRGIRLQQPKLPAAYTSLLPYTSGGGDQRFSNSKCLAYTVSTNNRISFNQVYFDAIGFPHRMRDTICFFAGSNIEVVNSYFNEPNFWRPNSTAETTPNAIFMESSGGPARIENNFFLNAHGITIFGSDSANAMMSDVTIRRNTFYEQADHNRSTSSYGYYRRHMTEAKCGVRWLIEGNTYDGGWPAGQQGASIAMSPRPCSTTRLGTNQLSDWTIRFNRIMFSPQPFIVFGHNDYGNLQPLGANRLTIRDNLIYTTGQSRSGATTGWPNGNAFNGQVMDIGLGIENLSVRHNSFLNISSTCCAANMLSHAYNQYNARLELSDNTYSVASSTSNYGVMIGGSFFGLDALQREWKSGDSAYSFSMSGNAMKYNSGDGNPYPSGNYRTTTLSNITGALYQNTILGDEAAWRPKFNGILADATARASDGKASGVDWDGLDSAIGNARNLRVLSITSSAANVHYTAPDATACTVEYGTSATVLTGARIVDSPAGSRFRTVALSGLSGGTDYHVRLYCARMTSVSFRTL